MREEMRLYRFRCGGLAVSERCLETEAGEAFGADAERCLEIEAGPGFLAGSERLLTGVSLSAGFDADTCFATF